MKQDRFLSRILFVFATFLLLLALASSSARADIAALVLLAGAVGAWALGRRWGALGEARPARVLVASTLGVGVLLTFIGGYCSVSSAGEVGPSVPELDSAILSLAVYLGLGVAALGASIIANVTTRAFTRRSPPSSDSAGPSPRP
jgi:hypothetical protein